MDLVQWGTGRLGSSMLSALCEPLPQPAACWVARRIAAGLASRSDLPMTAAFSHNLGVVLGRREGHREIRSAVQRLYANQLCSYVDLFSAMKRGPARIQAMVQIGVAHREGQGPYRGEGEFCSPPFRSGTRAEQASWWTQSILRPIEGFIKQFPDQWFVPYPVWRSDSAPSIATGRLTAEVIQG